jgi:uncharacterized protein (DUF433 family)
MATAVHVVGVSRERLSSWTRRGLVAPASHGHDNWEFDLTNLVRGRMIREIEKQGINIQRIADRIRDLSKHQPDPLINLVWAVDAGEMYTQFDDGMWTGGSSTHQGVMITTIDPEVIKIEVRRAINRQQADVGRTAHQRGVQGGKETFAGTRIPVTAVHAYFRHGRSTDDILRAYPDLEREDIEYARTTFVA